MASMNLACWNVQNLFDPDLNVGRGPLTQQELADKIQHLAGLIQAMFNGSGPDILGLIEVGDEAIFKRIVAALSGDYLTIWRPSHRPSDAGLGLAAKQGWSSDLRFLAEQKPTIQARPRCLLAELWLAGVGEPIIVALNHWKSRMPVPNDHEADKVDRLETARWLGDWLAMRAGNDPCVVCIGDFNADPIEPPFSEVGLRGRRHVSSALWSSTYLYNVAWRWLCEPDFWPRSQPYTESRPKTSHDTSPGVLFDQLLVSRRLLRNGPLTLQEATVRYHFTGLTSATTAQGVLRPKRWSYNGSVPDGASDHFPLLAEFR